MRQALYIIGSLLLAAVCGAVIMHSKDGEREAQDEILLLSHHIKSTDSIYYTDTLFYDRSLKVAANARADAGKAREDAYKHLTDTIYISKALAKDSAALAKDSTALKSCSDVKLTCERRVAERDSIIREYRSLKPSRISVGIGATCGYGFKGGDCTAGLTANVRVW